MTRIVHTAYRYKRPPGKRKPVALEVPAVGRAGRPEQRSDEATSDRITQSDDMTALPQRPAILSIQRKPAKILPPGLLAETPEEANRRGDAADALWRELVRRVREDR